MWTKVIDSKPPEGVILDTTSDNGKTVAKLIYKFGLWWSSDGNYQVIKAPIAYKDINDWG